MYPTHTTLNMEYYTLSYLLCVCIYIVLFYREGNSTSRMSMKRIQIANVYARQLDWACSFESLGLIHVSSSAYMLVMGRYQARAGCSASVAACVSAWEALSRCPIPAKPMPSPNSRTSIALSMALCFSKKKNKRGRQMVCLHSL